MADNGQIILEWGKFNDHADAFDQKNREMRETLNEIQKKINSLKGTFESDSAETIRQNITDMSKNFDDYQQVVDKYVRFIRNAAEEIRKTEIGIDNGASQLKINNGQYR